MSLMSQQDEVHSYAELGHANEPIGSPRDGAADGGDK